MKLLKFDSQKLNPITETPIEMYETGILGLYTVDEHPSENPNLAVFYPTESMEKEFHHPDISRVYDFDNVGFRRFLDEEMQPKKYKTTGGKWGLYRLVNHSSFNIGNKLSLSCGPKQVLRLCKYGWDDKKMGNFENTLKNTPISDIENYNLAVKDMHIFFRN